MNAKITTIVSVLGTFAFGVSGFERKNSPMCPFQYAGEFVLPKEYGGFFDGDNCVGYRRCNSALSECCANFQESNIIDCFLQLCQRQYPNSVVWFRPISEIRQRRQSFHIVEEDEGWTFFYWTILTSSTKSVISVPYGDSGVELAYSCTEFGVNCSSDTCKSVRYCYFEPDNSTDAEYERHFFSEDEVFDGLQERFELLGPEIDSLFEKLPYCFKFKFSKSPKIELAGQCSMSSQDIIPCSFEKYQPCRWNVSERCHYDEEKKICLRYQAAKVYQANPYTKDCDEFQNEQCTCDCVGFAAPWTEWSSTCSKAVRHRFVNIIGDEECNVKSPSCCVEYSYASFNQCSYPVKEHNVQQLKCINGIRITTSGNRSICKCNSGWTGSNCNAVYNIETNPCDSNPCQNGAECFKGPKTYLCLCEFGYKGKDCEREFTCEEEKNAPECMNGGYCVTDGETHRCRCPPNFSGSLCEFEENWCLEQTCGNNGICVNLTVLNTWECQCFEPFTGRRCEEKLESFFTNVPAETNILNAELDRMKLSFSKLLVIVIVIVVSATVVIFGITAKLCIQDKVTASVVHVNRKQSPKKKAQPNLSPTRTAYSSPSKTRSEPLESTNIAFSPYDFPARRSWKKLSKYTMKW